MHYWINYVFVENGINYHNAIQLNIQIYIKKILLQGEAYSKLYKQTVHL